MADADPRDGGLRASPAPLIAAYDTLLVDLDGVVYLGDRPVPGAADALGAVRGRGVRVVFVTNNAARTPTAVADQLRGLGVAARPDEVVTAAMAAAGLLATRVDAGAAVLVVGGDGVERALHDAGLRPVRRAADQPVAVVQGWSPDVDWAQLAEAAVALRAGAGWIATNLDRTLPSPRGPLPGNGALVAALATATGRQPESAGKPERALFEAAAADSAATALMVGDRLDTDIAGARGAGIDSLLVLSGVTDPAALLGAAPPARPDYVGWDLAAVRREQPEVTCDRTGAGAGAVTVRAAAGAVTVTGPLDEGDGLDALRALCALTWSGGCPVPAALAALQRLNLHPTDSEAGELQTEQ